MGRKVVDVQPSHCVRSRDSPQATVLPTACVSVSLDCVHRYGAARLLYARLSQWEHVGIAHPFGGGRYVDAHLQQPAR